MPSPQAPSLPPSSLRLTHSPVKMGTRSTWCPRDGSTRVTLNRANNWNTVTIREHKRLSDNVFHKVIQRAFTRRLFQCLWRGKLSAIRGVLKIGYCAHCSPKCEMGMGRGISIAYIFTQNTTRVWKHGKMVKTILVECSESRSNSSDTGDLTCHTQVWLQNCLQRQLIWFELLHHRYKTYLDGNADRSFNTHLLGVWVRIVRACPKTRTLILNLKIVLLLLLMMEMFLLTKGYPNSPTVHAWSRLIFVQTLKQENCCWIQLFFCLR